MEDYREMTALWSWIPDVVGLLGVAGVLGAYVLLQTGRWRQEEARYSMLNAAGAAGILFSLAFDFNLSAAMIELAWLVISLWALARSRARG